MALIEGAPRCKTYPALYLAPVVLLISIQSNDKA